jgi:hypothetical protein
MDFIRSHKLIVATIIIQIIALPLILLLVRQQQTTETQAQASTALYFEPSSNSDTPITTNVGENVTMDLMIDPGTNLISFAKVEINYDSKLLEPDPTNPVIVNTQAFPVIVEGPIVSPGKIQVVVSVGSDQTKVIQAVTKVLTLNMKAVNASTGTTNVSIGSTTQLLSIAPTDTSTENVLQTTTPATLSITAPTTPIPTVTPEPTPPGGSVNAWMESNGLVTMEAEDNDAKFNRNNYRWEGALPNETAKTDTEGWVGRGYIAARPNDDLRVFAGSEYKLAPEVVYNVCFATTGTYYVWMRSSGPDDLSDSAHMGIDGAYNGTMGLYWIGEGGATSNWQWKENLNTGTRATINITTPGYHTFHVYMREDGTRLDRIHLTTRANWTPSPGPSSQGPVLSERGTCPTTTSTPTPTVSPTPTFTPTPTVTPTLTPTPTPVPNTPTPVPNTPTPNPTIANTILNFNGLKLHGLGAGGDNPNPTSWGTLNPLRPTRNLKVEMFNTSGTLVHTGNTTITYTGPNTGLFNGSLTLPGSITTGTYTIKLTSPYYLTRLVPGFLNLVQGTTHSITSVALVAGDVNQDNQLRVTDYDLIMECYSDLLPAKTSCTAEKKTAADISDDGIVNQDDYNLFLRELSVQSGD